MSGITNFLLLFRMEVLASIDLYYDYRTACMSAGTQTQVGIGAS